MALHFPSSKISYFISFFIFLFSLSSSAQVKLGLKHLKKKNFDLAVIAFEADIFSTKEIIAIEAEYNLALIFSNKEYSAYDLTKSFQYIRSTIQRYEKAPIKYTIKIKKKGINQLNLKNVQQSIIEEALKIAKKKNTYTAYEYFLNNFESNNSFQTETAIKLRNKEGLKEMRKINKFIVYANFHKKYQTDLAQYSPKEDTLIQKLLFESFMEEKSWSAYSSFETKYPDNIYVKDSIAAVNYRPISSSQKIIDFKRFIVGFPNSPFAALAIQQIYHLTMQSTSLEDYDYFIHIYPEYESIDLLWKRFFQLYMKENSTNTVDQFKSIYTQAPKSIYD